VGAWFEAAYGRWQRDRGERQLYAEHVRATCVRESGYEDLLGLPVGLCPRRRNCWESTPWTDPQRRVRLVWAGGDVRLADGGALAYYAHRDGRPYPYRAPRHERATAADRLDAAQRRELLDSATIHAMMPASKHILTMQDARDYADAAPGTAWLREYGANTFDAVSRACASVGLCMADVMPALSSKGRPTLKAAKVRQDALVAMAPLFTEVCSYVDGAAVFGMHADRFAMAIATAKGRVANTPLQDVAATATIGG